MFTINPNHLDVNNLLKTFDFHYVDFKEEIKKDRNEFIRETSYTATRLEKGDLVVSFVDMYKSKKAKKHNVAKLKFQYKNFHEQEYFVDIVKKESRSINEIFNSIYTPNYNKIHEIIDLFIDEGQKSGMINTFYKRIADQMIMKTFSGNTYTNSISMYDKNIGDVYFNNVLQNGIEFKHNTHYKKSYINLDILYLVHSNHTMEPYFKIRLPFFESKKISCMMPMRGDKVYFSLNDKIWYTSLIDERAFINADEESLRSYFKDLFKQQVINTVSSKLKISKKDLNKMTMDEIKEHFILIEMIKI